MVIVILKKDTSLYWLKRCRKNLSAKSLDNIEKMQINS